MLKPILVLLTVASALPPVVLAAGLAEMPEYAAAKQALADGLPGVAALKTERMLRLKDWSAAELRELATFAAEAWTRAQDGPAVLKLVQAHDLEDEPFWHAQALTLDGNLAAARKILHEIPPAQRSARASLLLGQILAARGESVAARAELEPLTQSKDAQASRQARLLLAEVNLDEGRPAKSVLQNPTDAAGHYLRARALLEDGNIPQAESALQEVLASTRDGERVRHAAILLEAEILLRRNQPDTAHAHLLKFLDSTVESPLWTEAFDLLDRSHAAQPRPRLLPESVVRWMCGPNTAQQQPAASPALSAAILELNGHAMYVVARWLVADKRETEAVGLLEALLQIHPGHPRLADAMRRMMELYAAAGLDSRVLTLTEDYRKRFGDTSSTVDAAAGTSLFRQGEKTRALQAFQSAASLATTLTDRRRAVFNAALTAISAGDFGLYLALLGQLENNAGNAAATSRDSADSATTLELEKALYMAANHKPEAEESLRAFIRANPAHPRFPDACVALAEWMLMSKPPRVEHARTTLDMATTGASTPEQRQRVDCTRLWLREAAGDLKGLVVESTAFLKSWPKSPFTAEVRLRMASAHYRLEDYANARTEFEIIARDYPDTPHADTALYFAAMSASSVMSEEGRERALDIWDELASKGGALAVAARRQQALSERAQGRLPQALAALDKLLAIKGLAADQQRMTVCEKAEVLLLLGKTEPARLDVAVGLLNDFLSDAALPIFWKARAGFTLATIHHDAGRDTEALEACYNVLRAAEISPPASPADYLWFSKAGFFGVDLLEAARQWESAARLAEQIAQRPGNRSVEARERATTIRLEHFLWDGPAPTPPKELKLEDKAESLPAGKPASKSSTKK